MAPDKKLLLVNNVECKIDEVQAVNCWNRKTESGPEIQEGYFPVRVNNRLNSRWSHSLAPGIVLAAREGSKHVYCIYYAIHLYNMQHNT